jgi:hypothetical protein
VTRPGLRSGLRWTLLAAALVVAGHVLAVLWSGGYSVEAFGRRLAGGRITSATMLLALLAAGAVLLAGREALSRRAWRHAPVLLFCGLLTLYLANGRTLWSGDTLPARYLPISVLREGNFDLDEFPFLYTPAGTHHPELSPPATFTRKGDLWLPYYVERAGGHYVSLYPVAGPLLAALVYVPSVLGGLPAEHPIFYTLEKLAAAALVALSVAVLYLALLRVSTEPRALAIALVYAVGTSSLSVSSQALWQHGPSQLALAAALYGALRSRGAPRWGAATGFCLGVAVICRPTDLLLAAPLAVHLAVREPRGAPLLALGGLPPLAFQLAYNHAYFGHALHSSLGVGWHFWSTPLREGLPGILLSPGRGLLVYSPVFLFALGALALSWRRGGDGLLRSLSIGVGLEILLYGKWVSWWGGHCYGPRLLADLAPVLALALYPVPGWLAARRTWKALFVVAVVLSVYAHVVGAFLDDGSWSSRMEIERHPERVWRWSDNPLVDPAVRLVRGTRSMAAPGR